MPKPLTCSALASFAFAALALFLAGAPAPCHADAIPLQGQIAASAYDNGTVPVNTTASARRLINDLLETHG
ncbi:MAG: hypothetical protein LBT53_06505, partial [Puniceicoccales bacterium]|nr:hypothetical protein [Puniceicoccales bacterium]